MKNIAVFASGSGSNFQALAEAADRSELGGRIAALVVDKPRACVIERAAKFPDVKVFVVNPRDFGSKREYESEIVRLLEPLEIELICLAGYMRICGPELLEAYNGKIINIHPSLLPSFKGAHAIRDAFEFGVKVFGVTIHYVDETLDGGQIIAQAPFSYTGNDIDELEANIHRIEHRLYTDTVKNLLQSNL